MTQQNQRNNRNTRRRYTAEDKQCGPFPRHFGRGANITFILPSGQRIKGDPNAYRKLGREGQQSVVKGICSALGIKQAA